MEQRAVELGVEIASPELERFLEERAAAAPFQSILEVGTGLGAGTLALARGAPQARLTTLERYAERAAAARSFFELAGILERTEIAVGEARDLLPALAGPFDLVVLDCDVAQRIRCLDLALPKLVVGGLLIVGEPLFGLGQDPPEGLDDEAAEAVFAFYGYFTMHPQIEARVEPIGTGVGVAAKSRPLVTEMGGPF